MYLNPKNRSVSFQKRLKMFYFHHFKVFTRSRFQNVPIRVPFSKSAVFKICRQKMCRFRVNRRPIRRIFHRFQNVPASCERSLNLNDMIISTLFLIILREDAFSRVGVYLKIGVSSKIFGAAAICE